MIPKFVEPGRAVNENCENFKSAMIVVVVEIFDYLTKEQIGIKKKYQQYVDFYLHVGFFETLYKTEKLVILFMKIKKSYVRLSVPLVDT